MATAARFTPRATFEGLSTLTVPRSYYLGHHAAALAKMKQMLEQIDLVIECRDYRIPHSSRNPQLEHLLGDTQSRGTKSRIVVFTKCDLGWADSVHVQHRRRRHDALLRKHVAGQAPGLQALFTTASQPRSARELLQQIKSQLGERAGWSLTGHRVLVAGMPNVGKSTLLNALRAAGSSAGKGKAARTGAQPGVTRSIATSVKIVDAEAEDAAAGTAGDASNVYVLDTPGVFVPYVPSARAMLHLALCGCVKDGVVPPVTLADYLLYKLNLHLPLGRSRANSYLEYTVNPTNSVQELLEAVAQRTGRLAKGGVLDIEGAADWFVKRWRSGRLDGGRFVLEGPREDDDGDAEGDGLGEGDRMVSLSQARKLAKEMRVQKGREKRATGR